MGMNTAFVVRMILKASIMQGLKESEIGIVNASSDGLVHAWISLATFGIVMGMIRTHPGSSNVILVAMKALKGCRASLYPAVVCCRYRCCHSQRGR
jgi:hypothetical protein